MNTMIYIKNNRWTVSFSNQLIKTSPKFRSLRQWSFTILFKSLWNSCVLADWSQAGLVTLPNERWWERQISASNGSCVDCLWPLCPSSTSSSPCYQQASCGVSLLSHSIDWSNSFDEPQIKWHTNIVCFTEETLKSHDFDYRKGK